MKSWFLIIGVVTATSGVAGATGGGATLQRLDRDRDRPAGKVGSAARRRPTPPAPTAQVGTLARQGLRGWDQGARTYGFTNGEVVHGATAAAHDPIYWGHPRSYWAQQAPQMLRDRGLPASYMHVSDAELEDLFWTHKIGEEVYGAIKGSRAQ